MSWMADDHLKSSLYQKQPDKVKGWTEPVLQIKKRLEELLDCKFDFVLLNMYRDGNDYIAYHRDQEAFGEDNEVIASISLGETRRFILKYNPYQDPKSTNSSDETKDEPHHVEDIEYQLSNGSLIVMAGKTQEFWKHGVPKQLKVKNPRINLTFRIH